MLIDQSNINTCLKYQNSRDLRSLSSKITRAINMLSDDTLISSIKNRRECNDIKCAIEILSEFKAQISTLKEVKIEHEKAQEQRYTNIRNTIIQAIPKPSTPEAYVKIILWLLLFSKKDYKLVQHNITERFIKHVPGRIEAIANLKNLDYRYERKRLINQRTYHL